MKRLALLLGLVLLMLLLIGCRGKSDFDVETEGILDVIVISRPSHLSAREETETRYYSLANHRRIRSTEAFESDQMTILTVPNTCFESYIDRTNRVFGRTTAVRNRLDHMALEDEDRNPVAVSAEQAKIFQHIAELEHDLFHIRFIETGGETFVYLELNVNLWTPCCLYWYDRETDALILLHEWDDEEVVGLRLRNITLAR